MMGPHRNSDLLVRHGDTQAVRLHRLHMRGPLIDERDVLTKPRKIGRDAASVSARAEHCNLLSHELPSYPCQPFSACAAMARRLHPAATMSTQDHSGVFRAGVGGSGSAGDSVKDKRCSTC
jgi:hypothetical protein